MIYASYPYIVWFNSVGPPLQVGLQVCVNLGYFIFTHAQQGLQSMCQAIWCPSEHFCGDDLSQDRGAREMRA